MHLFSYFSPFVISPFPPLDSSPYLSIHDPPPFSDTQNFILTVFCLPPSSLFSIPQFFIPPNNPSTTIIYPISPSPKLHTPPSPPFKYTFSVSL